MAHVSSRTDEGIRCIDEAFAASDRLGHWLHASADFRLERHGGTPFTVARLPDVILRQVCYAVEDAIGERFEHAVVFARLSTREIDTAIRIHTDAMMGGSHAFIWSPADPVHPKCGTGFFDHAVHGKSLSFAPEHHAEHARLLSEDAGTLKHWSLRTVVPLAANRLTIYPAHLFHCRYPFRSWGSTQGDGRVVLVGFGDI